MLPALKLLIVFILHTTEGDEEAIMIKLRPEQIINTFRSVISSAYLKKLANDFAVKAANHFIDAIRNKETELSIDNYRTPRMEKIQKSEDELLNEPEVQTLLKDPLPDGDNLDILLDHSDEASKVMKKKKKIPVIELRKINGIYYRRLLGLI
ncbi:uncharacterized protein LOC115454370 [Manduca sexta]|uniref:uncharacterized protein LOC115454370 n=1 Tax=Manduca sexta TaxID=7130 RepID=UPI001183B863|nr:uncharacterized protein LOC115454370 [Manduca sexta]KAG6438715.1 hypothetical protein O3G_MSEX000168 [Manduca sexta]